MIASLKSKWQTIRYAHDLGEWIEDAPVTPKELEKVKQLINRVTMVLNKAHSRYERKQKRSACV
jgi:uncharacterized protein YprB with RNaseH-like and TPR domain